MIHINGNQTPASAVALILQGGNRAAIIRGATIERPSGLIKYWQKLACASKRFRVSGAVRAHAREARQERGT